MLTQRLGSDTQKNDEFTDALIEKIKENPGSCDEVWFATDYGFPSMETHKKSAGILKKQAEKFRNAGVRVSLQISNTLGHGSYMSARDCSGLVYEGSEVEKLVGDDGKTADYCFCWNGENLRKYVTEEIKIYCSALKPYTVWIDDDLRAVNHAPVGRGCFCPRCIESFNRKYKCDFSREELIYEINRGDISWREKWVEFIRDGIYDFTYAAAGAVHEASPESFMGLQHCANGGYTGYDLSFMFDAMYKVTGRAPKSRPGGGAYSDHNPNEQIDKAIFLSWQNRMLPGYIEEIRPEIENLPDVVYGKTVAGTCFETGLYLAWGSNAMSYALLMNDYEPMTFHGEMLSEFARHRPYWEKLAALSSGTKPGGLTLPLSSSMWKRKIKDSEPDFDWEYEPWRHGTELLRTGIPICYCENEQPVYLLHSELAEVLSDEELIKLLSFPVITDGKTLTEYKRRGLEDNFSAGCEEFCCQQFSERFTGHEINASAQGRSWSQSFYYNTGWRIIKKGRAEVLSYWDTESLNAEIFDKNGEYPYGIADAVIETQTGAKWAVFGQNPWNDTISFEKRSQIVSAADYISGNALPAYIETPIQAIILPGIKDGKTAGVSVVNCTIGKSGPVKIRIRKPAGENFNFMSADKTQDNLPFIKDGEDYIITLPSCEPWSVSTVFIK